MQPLTLVHKLLIFWYLHAFSSGRKTNTRCKARENRSPDSNSYSMHVYIKRIHLHAFETQTLTIKISQSVPVNLVSYLSFFHNCFYEEGKKKKYPRKNASNSCALLILLWVFCFYIFAWWYFMIWTFWQFNGVLLLLLQRNPSGILHRMSLLLRYRLLRPFSFLKCA